MSGYVTHPRESGASIEPIELVSDVVVGVNSIYARKGVVHLASEGVLFEFVPLLARVEEEVEEFLVGVIPQARLSCGTGGVSVRSLGCEVPVPGSHRECLLWRTKVFRKFAKGS